MKYVAFSCTFRGLIDLAELREPESQPELPGM